MRKLVFMALFSLAGCASVGGAVYSPPQTPAKGMAQLVVYENSAWKKTSQEVDINGVTACSLVQGGFFIRNVPAGSTTISSSIWDLPGTSRLTVNAQAGHRYYVRVQYDLAAARVGPFAIDNVDEGTAKSELRSLKMMNGCSTM